MRSVFGELTASVAAGAMVRSVAAPAVPENPPRSNAPGQVPAAPPPATRTEADEPTPVPTLAPTLLTVPPLVMLSEPTDPPPPAATTKNPPTVHAEVGPSTTARPCPTLPMRTLVALDALPPARTENVP